MIVYNLVRADAAPPTVITRSEFNFDGFQKITVEEALETLKTVPAKTCELDKIPTWLIKDLADVFAPILAKLVNASISSGIMPEGHKFAIICPRLKKSNLDLKDPSSYRPVSNVSFLSKFVECIANRQLEQYFSNNDNNNNNNNNNHSLIYAHIYSRPTAQVHTVSKYKQI